MADNTLFQLAPVESKSVVVRRKEVEMFSLSSVRSVMNETDLIIVDAIQEAPIGSMPTERFVKEFGLVLKYSARDVGIVGELSEYDGLRLSQIAKRYYPMVSISEIKLAFELAIMGKLDEWLPQRHGVADRNHYQQLSVEYFTKIMNAYMARRGKVSTKAIRVIESEKYEAEQARRIAESSRKVRNECVLAYLEYKYRGTVEIEYTRSFYMILRAVGLAGEAVVTQKHINQRRIQSKVFLPFETPEEEYARLDSIIEAFDYVVTHELQITDFI